MRAYRDEANSTLNKSLDRSNGFNIVQASTEYVAAANTLAILELAEQQRIANLIALAALPSDAPDELLELRTEAAFHLVEYRQNGLDDEHLAVLPEIAVSLGMDTDEAYK